MSKDLILADMKIPAHLAKRINQPSALSTAMAAGISSGEAIPKISIKSSRFRIVEDGTETVLKELELHTIVVGANPKVSKVFYSGAWSADADPEAPDCFSLNGVTPDISVQEPENPVCATCPNSQWGSKILDGKELKACADKKRLAIVAADDPEGTVYLLEVTPAALKNLNQYQKELTQRGIPVEVVRTVVSFDPDASFPKLVFKFGGFLDEDTLATVEALHGTEEVLRITGESDLAIPTTTKAVEEEVEEEEEEAPVASFGKKKAAPAETRRPAKKKVVPVEEVEEVEEEEEEPVSSFGKKKDAAKTTPPKKSPTTTEKAKAAVSDEAQSLASEIEDLLGDDFDA